MKVGRAQRLLLAVYGRLAASARVATSRIVTDLSTSNPLLQYP
jgi:hypothetical protein